VSTLIVIDDGGDVRGKKHAVLLRDVSSKDEIAAEGASERASERAREKRRERKREREALVARLFLFPSYIPSKQIVINCSNLVTWRVLSLFSLAVFFIIVIISPLSVRLCLRRVRLFLPKCAKRAWTVGYLHVEWKCRIERGSRLSLIDAINAIDPSRGLNFLEYSTRLRQPRGGSGREFGEGVLVNGFGNRNRRRRELE